MFGHCVNLALKGLIISPNLRNRNLLKCKCKTNVWHLICEHALAVALNLEITFDCLVEVKKKILTSRKSKGFTRAVNMNPSFKGKHKCNKEMKSASSERQRFATVSVSSKTPKGSSTSDQLISAGYIKPNIQPFSTILILPNTKPIPSSISSLNQPFLIPSNKQPILNNANALTQDYHRILIKSSCCLTMFLCVMAAIANFLDLERAFPSNLVIKHRNRRITGRNPTAEPLITADYQCTYYHFSNDYVAKKNPMFLFNPTVHISSAFYKQLMQLDKVQQMFHFSSLNIESQQ